jgi:hypothetical protein
MFVSCYCAAPAEHYHVLARYVSCEQVHRQQLSAKIDNSSLRRRITQAGTRQRWTVAYKSSTRVRFLWLSVSQILQFTKKNQ